jgi:hypothetical protein
MALSKACRVNLSPPVDAVVAHLGGELAGDFARGFDRGDGLVQHRHVRFDGDRSRWRWDAGVE